jgi:hypothetical protein
MTDPFKQFANDLRRSGKSSVPMAMLSYVDLLAGRVLTNAKKRSPVRTGALRRSGRIEKFKNANGEVRVVSFGGEGTGVQYAAAIEFGRYNPVGRQRGSTTSPQPFLRPALIEEMKKARPDMKRVLNMNLKHLNKTYGGRF